VRTRSEPRGSPPCPCARIGILQVHLTQKIEQASNDAILAHLGLFLGAFVRQHTGVED
jgi:hypothetical protein